MGRGARTPEGWFWAVGVALLAGLAPMALRAPERGVAGTYLAVDGERRFDLDLRADGSFRLSTGALREERTGTDASGGATVVSLSPGAGEAFAAGTWSEEDGAVTFVADRPSEEPPRGRVRDREIELEGFGLRLRFTRVGP